MTNFNDTTELTTECLTSPKHFCTIVSILSFTSHKENCMTTTMIVSLEQMRSGRRLKSLPSGQYYSYKDVPQAHISIYNLDSGDCYFVLYIDQWKVESSRDLLYLETKLHRHCLDFV